MITRIEIDGYKSFEKFSMDFGPFTVIAGVNGVGKSNLFDTLRHLSHLVSETLVEAFVTDRGSYEELFLLYPNSERCDRISYAVEMLLPKVVEDQFSTKETLQNLRLRYELSVKAESTREFSILKERLTYIKRSEDKLLKQNREVKNIIPQLKRGRQTPFIDTNGNQITIHQDGNAGRKRAVSREGAKRTVLSSITTVEFPHAYAARKSLENIHFLQLNPERLRTPSKFSASHSLEADGSNLSAMLARLIQNDPDVEQMISNDLSTVVPGVAAFFLEEDKTREEYIIGVKHIDGYRIPSNLLSDGTLRILALIAISYDPEFNGIIILEEPENGVHPGRIPQIVDILRDMTGFPNVQPSFRQIIANTHSPALTTQIRGHSLAFAIPKRVVDKNGPHTITDVHYAEDNDMFGQYQRKQYENMLSDNKQSDELAPVL